MSLLIPYFTRFPDLFVDVFICIASLFARFMHQIRSANADNKPSHQKSFFISDSLILSTCKSSFKHPNSCLPGSSRQVLCQVIRKGCKNLSGMRERLSHRRVIRGYLHVPVLMWISDVNALVRPDCGSHLR